VQVDALQQSSQAREGVDALQQSSQAREGIIPRRRVIATRDLGNKSGR
jgi:hypothetical protein